MSNDDLHFEMSEFTMDEKTLPPTDAMRAYLEQEGYSWIQTIPGRGYCGLRKFLFTVAIISGLDAHGYKGRWCYAGLPEAAVALSQWDGNGDPPGNWIKYKGEGGERTNPKNDG